jgi:hypothetical protein
MHTGKIQTSASIIVGVQAPSSTNNQQCIMYLHKLIYFFEEQKNDEIKYTDKLILNLIKVHRTFFVFRRSKSSHNRKCF